MSGLDELSPDDARRAQVFVQRALARAVRADGMPVPAWAEPLLRDLAERGDAACSVIGTASVRVVSQPDDTSWVGVTPASDRLGLSTEYVRRLCRSGRVRCRRTGGVWVVDIESLARVTKRRSAA